MNALFRSVFVGASLVLASLAASASESGERVLLTVFSGEGQIQGTAMNVATALANNDHEVHILLCGRAGELALRDRMPETLEPRTITPREMMEEAMTNGATVSVCPLFLPNTAFGRYGTDDFLEQVTEDSSEEMAERLTQADTRLLSF